MLRAQQTRRLIIYFIAPGLTCLMLGEWVSMQIISAKQEIQRSDDEVLRGSGLWQSSFLSLEEQRTLAGVIGSPQLVDAHTDLVRQGEVADKLLLIVNGWACRYTSTREGGRQILAILLPGDLCNLDSLLFDRLDCGVRTLTRASVATLPRESALALATQHAGIAKAFTWLAFVENAMLGKMALALGRQSAKEKLAHLLCELSVRVGTQGEDEHKFELPLNQEQIADALGLTSVHVNRTLQLLRAEGLVATERRTMTLRSVSKLRQIGGFDPHYLHIKPAEAVPRPRQLTRSCLGRDQSHSLR